MGVCRSGPAWLVRQVSDWNSPAGTMAVRAVGLAVNFGVLAVIARWAGQEVLGVIIVLNGAAFLGGGVGSLGIPTLLLKTIPGCLLIGEKVIAAAHYRRGLRIVSFTSAGIAIALALIALAQGLRLLPASIGSFGPLEVTAMGVCSLAMAIQFVGISAIRAVKKPAWSGVFQFCTPPLLLAVFVCVSYVWLGTVTRGIGVGALILTMLLNAGFVTIFARRELGRGHAASLEPITWPETRSMWLVGVLGSAASNIPLLFAAMLLDPVSVAITGISYRICNLPMTVVSALGAYYAPMIREAYLRRDLRLMRGELKESQWLGALLVFPVLLAAILFPDLTLGLFRIHNSHAVVVLRIFAFAQLVIASCGVCEQYLSMLGRATLAFRISLVACLLIAVSSWTSAANWGVIGLALAWTTFSALRQLTLWSMCVRCSFKIGLDGHIAK